MGSNRTRNAAVVTLLFLALLCTGAPARAAEPGAAQAYPLKPLRMIVTFPAGASSDIVGRLIGEKLAAQLGQPVVTDNRAGAGGNVGLAVAAKSAPDGYTMVIATASIAVSPAIYEKLGYDPVKDFAALARLTNIPNVLIVPASAPAKTLRQFIDLVRANPGKLNFGSGGVGTANHLTNEFLKHLERIDMVHVPYKGVTQAMQAMMGGEVHEVVMPLATALPQIHAGRVRALAVLAEQRIASLPDVPTGTEAGVPGFTMPVWYGMFAPAGTPRDIVSRLGRELVKALETQDLRERLAALGVEPWPGTSDELAELLRVDIERYAIIVRSAGLAKQ